MHMEHGRSSYRNHQPELPDRIDDPNGLMSTIISRLDVSRERGSYLKKLFGEALESTSRRRQEVERHGYVEKDPAAERFLREFTPALISQESIYKTPDSFKGLFRRLEEGVNTILASHHSSPIDRHIIFALLQKTDPRLLDRAAFVIDTYGHSPLSHVLQRGVNTIQVRSEATINDRENAHEMKEMRGQNVKAMKELIRLVRDGGRLIVVFPEGTTNPNGLGPAAEGSGEIFDAVYRHSPKHSSMFPAYALGSRIMMPFEGIIYSRSVNIETSTVEAEVGEEIPLKYIIPEEKGPDHRTQIGENVILTIAKILPPGLRGEYAQYFR
jgi:hypothetical protein